MQASVRFPKRLVTFQGRARRREFWLFALVNLVVGEAALVVGHTAGTNVPVLVCSAVFLVPLLAVATRRLHDTGRSAWWLLLVVIPFGSLAVLAFCASDSKPGTNEYGAFPKPVTV